MQADAALPLTARSWWLVLLRDRLTATLLAQRGHLMPWVPVALGTGIGVYFLLPTEPGPAFWGVLAGLTLGLSLAAWLTGPAWGPLLMALALVVAGIGLAGVRTHVVAAPVLGFRYYGPIEGRIVEIDRSASDALRLTLDRVVLEDMAPARVPTRVRISLRGEQQWAESEPGRSIMTTGHLSGPSGPAEPGDFDFRRLAWFEGLGAVGYTQSPVLTLAPPAGGLWTARLRAVLSGWVRARIPGDPGGFAAAVMTGDRSGISVEANQSMRDSGIYHLVSISGTHMGMLAAFVFGLVRTAVALVPPLALRVNGKKVAALVALPVATFYFALAGRDVATERSFIMVAVMLGAVLFDRQAITLRSVAIAALIVLLLRPESVTNAGFQMSFAAVTALTWAFGAPWLQTLGGQRRWLTTLLIMVASSLVAGVATAPFAGAHFNRFAAYGLLANLMTVPLMGMLVMPGAVLLAIGGPFGLTQPALLMVNLGCRWILMASDWIASIDGAVSGIVTPPGPTVAILTAGALVLMLWQGRGRWMGLAGILAGIWLWVGADRPDLLVSSSGGLIGVAGEAGRVLSRGTGEAFTAEAWLENDGDTALQEVGGARPGLAVTDRTARATLGGTEVLVARGERALADLDGCGGANLLVTDVDEAGPRPCLVLDALALRETGAVAGRVEDGVLRLWTAAQAAGDRPWTRAGREPGAAAILTLEP